MPILADLSNADFGSFCQLQK